jgi:hypothetical protein
MLSLHSNGSVNRALLDSFLTPYSLLSRHLQPEKLTQALVDEEENENKGERQSYVGNVITKLENIGRKLASPSISLSDSYKCYNRAGWCNQSDPSDSGSSEDPGSSAYKSFLWWSNSSSRRQRNLRGGGNDGKKDE